MHELRTEAEPTLAELVPHLSPVDLVIVEGFKSEGHAKLEVHRESVGKPLLFPNDSNIVAIARDRRPPNARLPFAALDDVEAIAEIVDKLARPYPP
jgi:molybdopterin-guanine dinucleotide biosynthesis protein B